MVGNGSDDKEGFDHFIASLEADSEESKAKADDIGNTTAIIVMAGVIIAFFAAIVMGIVISRSISKPVVGMTEAAKKVREGNLDVSVDERGSDEIAELGKAFNQMVLSVRLVAGEMGMDMSAEARDGYPEPANGGSDEPSPAIKDK